MADSDRIVFPDEVSDLKAAAAEAKNQNTGGDTNSVEEPPVEVQVTSRNVIQAPANCPPGFQMGADGVCREVF